jgi:hypothetical protein
MMLIHISIKCESLLAQLLWTLSKDYGEIHFAYNG